MTCTRKDYVRIAALLNEQHARAEDAYAPRGEIRAYRDAVEDIATALVPVFQADNPRFDRARFLAAAIPGPEYLCDYCDNPLAGEAGCPECSGPDDRTHLGTPSPAPEHHDAPVSIPKAWTFDPAGFVIAYEQGDLDEDAVVEGFQNLVDTGIVWSLQGSYGHTARALIDAGLVTDDRRPE